MNRATIWACGVSVSVLGTWLLLGADPVPAQDDANKGMVEFAGLKNPVPKDWHEARILNPDSYKRYQLDPVGDIKYNGHVNLYRLDKDKTVSATDQLKRWQQMFIPPEGQTTPVPGKVTKFKIASLEANSIDISGTIKGFPDDPEMAYLDWRLIGVYVQTPKGTYLATLIGPTGLVEYYHKEFEDWLKGLK